MSRHLVVQVLWSLGGANNYDRHSCPLPGGLSPLITTPSVERNKREHPTAGASFKVRCKLLNIPGTLAGLLTEVGKMHSDVRSVELIETFHDYVVRDITILGHDPDHARSVIDAMHQAPNVEISDITDLTLAAHEGGKIRVEACTRIETGDDLARVYTPGVGRICQIIAKDPSEALHLTAKGNSVAIVTDGSAVLGLGNLGPLAALPVMEGKALLFRQMAGISSWPILVDDQTVEGIVAAVCAIAPGFGAINLEDIGAPRCFEVERQLAERLPIPVFHDDQHGTAVVVLAALYNALDVCQRPLEDLRVVVCGFGAAGSACARILQHAGIDDIIGVDKDGIVGDEHHGHTAVLSPNPRHVTGSLADALAGADVLIGTSTGGLVTRQMVETMREPRIVFALANPEPEVRPEDVGDLAAIVATGRSDYPNQINNALCFPGLFRGLLDSHAREVTPAMLLAAAHAIAGCVPRDMRAPDNIMPSLLDASVARVVADAIIETVEHQRASSS